MRRIDELPEIDLSDPAIAPTRLETLNAARTQSPLARSTRGIEVLGYEAASAALQDTQVINGVPFLMKKMGVDARSQTRRGRTLTMSDGDEHRRIRSALSKWFTPKRVSEMRQGVVELVEDLVEPMSAAGGGDFYRDVARRLPGPVFCWMIGAPTDRADELFELSETLLLAFTGDPRHAESVNSAGKAMGGFVADLVDQKRRAPADDLMSIMLDAADAGTLTIEDVQALAFEMLGASTDNTATSAGLMINLLAEAPHQWAALRDSRDLVSRAIEEALRFDPPVIEITKYAPEGTTLLDVEIPRESMLFVSVLAANHDPSAFTDPQRFDVGRKQRRPQLNFGLGRHFCLGAALARMELSAMLEVLVDRWRVIELTSTADIDRSYGAKVLSVPVTVDPG